MESKKQPNKRLDEAVIQHVSPENSNIEHEKEVISLLKEKMTKKQVINFAVLLLVSSMLILVSMLLSNYTVEFWKDVVFNLVCAFFVLSGFWTLSRLVYQLVNGIVSKAYPNILTDQEKNKDLPANMVHPRRGRPPLDKK